MARKFVLLEVETNLPNDTLRKSLRAVLNYRNQLNGDSVDVIQLHVNTAKKEKKETK